MRKKKNEVEEIVETEVVETIEEPEVEVTEEVVEEVTEEPEKEFVEAIPVVTFKAIVKGASKLNVRKEANKESEPLCVIDEGTEVEVNEQESTETFYKVTLASGIEGYCVKEYIKAK